MAGTVHPKELGLRTTLFGVYNSYEEAEDQEGKIQRWARSVNVAGNFLWNWDGMTGSNGGGANNYQQCGVWITHSLSAGLRLTKTPLREL